MLVENNGKLTEVHNECLVKGCVNSTKDGILINDILCYPCYYALKTGKPGNYGNTFFHRQKEHIIGLENILMDIKGMLE